MGVLNVTPDSFSDGGQFLDTKSAVCHALRMAEQGADIIDIGGESTRPGSDPVSINDELARVIPVIEGIRGESAIPISIDTYKPTEDGDPPLGRAIDWKTPEGYHYELSTMPGFAGSSAYYLRYMDPKNKEALVSKEANEYWQDVDLYIGGTEHATGHLIYSRFWNKFLFDLGLVVKNEPFKKLINHF
jgi:hypothetical protein